MTCIVGIAQDGKVYMGGDSAMTDDSTRVSMLMPKVFIRGEYIIGYAGNARFGKILQHNIKYPSIPANVNNSEKLDAFVNGILIKEIKSQMNTLNLEKEEKEEFSVLLGIRGHIFEFQQDWAIYELLANYNAIGSGGLVAMGSLYTTEAWKSPEKRVRVALEAAARYCPSVGEPLDILSI